jgi:predicted outer membrane repeat protein
MMQAGNGGALYALHTQTVNITGGTTFENCSATQFGGGAVAATHIQLTVSVDGAEFISNICNSTDSSSQGGAVS